MGGAGGVARVDWFVEVKKASTVEEGGRAAGEEGGDEGPWGQNVC